MNSISMQAPAGVLMGDLFSVLRGIVHVRGHVRVLHRGPEVQLHAPWVPLLVDLCTQLENSGHDELTSTSNIDAPWPH